MVTVGARNVRGTLHVATSVQDTTGHEVVSWLPLAEQAVDWAEILPSGGREFFLAHQTFGELSAQLRFRYRTDLSESMRFLTDEGDVWDFVSPPYDPDGRRKEIRIVAVKRA